MSSLVCGANTLTRALWFLNDASCISSFSDTHFCVMTVFLSLFNDFHRYKSSWLYILTSFLGLLMCFSGSPVSQDPQVGLEWVGLLWEKLTRRQPTCTVPTSARAQWQPCRPGHGVISRLAHFPGEARAAARESPHSARASRSWEPGFWPRLLTRSSKGDPFYLGILPVCSTCFCLTHWGKIEHLWGEWRICYSQGLFRSLLTCYMC